MSVRQTDSMYGMLQVRLTYKAKDPTFYLTVWVHCYKVERYVNEKNQ